MSVRRCKAPGVQLQTLYGGVGGAGTSVDLRGFGAFATANTLLLINGRRVNDIDLQGVDFSTIPRDSIERIEITKGNSGAVLYGDNAMGGVINATGGPNVSQALNYGVTVIPVALSMGTIGFIILFMIERRDQKVEQIAT